MTSLLNLAVVLFVIALIIGIVGVILGISTLWIVVILAVWPSIAIILARRLHWL